jgi:molybdopterin synthase sulfur carrier subunit
MIRVVLPQHLRTLAGTGAEVALEVDAPVTIRRVLDVLEARHSMLRGTIREYGTGQRRAFLRFFVCEEDWSHESVDAQLPAAVVEGSEPLLIIGAIAGGSDQCEAAKEADKRCQELSVPCAAQVAPMN